MESTTAAKPAVSRRTGGRSALVLGAVKAATEQLIDEKGRERVTVPMIAERAGVNPTSIYRRWGDLPTLINDIATYRLDPARPLPDSGDLRADLVGWAQELITRYLNPVNAALLRGGASVAGDNESDCLRDRRTEATMFIQRHAGSSSASATGITPDDVINHVIAPIIYRVIFNPASLDLALADSLVDDLFRIRA
jgi:AcrR family transcriptional regulator